MPGAVTIIIAVVITLVIAIPVTSMVAISYRQKVVEAKLGSADEKARQIIDDALKVAETKKREALLEAKEESLKTKNELERETRERRTELQRYEKRVLSKEESVDKKADALERRESGITAKEEELKKNHSKMPHGGFVIRSGETGTEGNKHVIEYSLKLDSNPEFTASVLICYARAAYRLSKAGESGAKSVFDIAPAMLSQKTPEELRKELL